MTEYGGTSHLTTFTTRDDAKMLARRKQLQEVEARRKTIYSQYRKKVQMHNDTDHTA